MADRFNTIAGWTLFSGIVALGLGSISGHYFRANKENRPDPMGFKIDGVVEEGTAGAAGPPIEALLGDAAKGQKSFAKCASCHSINPGGANGQGPNLAGIYGDKQGEGRGGYPFSDGLKAKGGVWDDTSLDAWLANPSGYVPGTKMSFAGLSDAQERANVIAYLKTAK